MKQPKEKKAHRQAYEKPVVSVVHEKELLELLGPAQGYGTMPLDLEWN